MTSWIAAELELDAPLVSPYADALLENGALSVDVKDAQAGTSGEQAIFAEPGEEVTLAWGNNLLVGLFAPDTDVAGVLRRSAEAIGLKEVPAYRTYAVDDQDWVRLTQSQFEPISVSDRLWIVPSWHAPRDEAAINVVLDPGLAFGTGTHPTTRLCLDWLDGHLQPERSVIDYGCGSGILAIVAAKLGAFPVTGIDVDQQSLEAARYNAARNNVLVQFFDAHVRDIEPADVVIANILSAPLMVLAPLLSSLTRPAGSLVLSGILAPQAEAVAEHYRPWFEMRVPVTREGWVRLEGTRQRD